MAIMIIVICRTKYYTNSLSNDQNDITIKTTRHSKTTHLSRPLKSLFYIMIHSFLNKFLNKHSLTDTWKALEENIVLLIL